MCGTLTSSFLVKSASRSAAAAGCKESKPKAARVQRPSRGERMTRPPAGGREPGRETRRELRGRAIIGGRGWRKQVWPAPGGPAAKEPRLLGEAGACDHRIRTMRSSSRSLRRDWICALENDEHQRRALLGQ